MMRGAFCHSWKPALTPCIHLFRAQQLTNLRHFRPHARPPRVTARAATLDPTQSDVKATERTTGFRQLGLSQELVAATQQNDLTEPTEIQAAAIPRVIQGGDVLLASHTGSGKTLAYLLPLVHKLRQSEAEGRASKAKRPRAVVLGPTRELTDQILRVAKSLSHHARFRSACVNGGGTHAQQAAALASPLDILVATPQKLLQHAQKGNVFYGDVQYVVLDEADTMFDRGFGPEVESVLGPLRSKPEPAQCILVAATLTKPIRRLLEEKFPDMQRIETKSLHKGVVGARHTFLPQQPGQNKMDLLHQVVAGEQRRGHRVMVFCNTLDSCRAADKYLEEQGVPSLTYHGDVPLDGRRQAIQQFAQGGQTEPGQRNNGSGSSQPVLVCTDLAARGLDIPGNVDHVVNFDFPYNPVDYLHRTGRTARAGQKGRVTSLVAKGDQVLAGRIDQALQQGLPMDELSADKRSLPPNMRPKPETLKRRSIERKMSQSKGVRGAARFGRTSSSSSADAPRARKTGQTNRGSSKSGPPRKFGQTSSGSSKDGPPRKFGQTSSGSSKDGPPRRFGQTSSGSSKDGPPRRFGQTGPSRRTDESSSKEEFPKPGGFSRSTSGRSNGRKSFSPFSDKKTGAPSSSKFSKFSKSSGSSFQSSKSSGTGSSFGKFGKSSVTRPGKKRGLGSHRSFK